MQNNKIEGDPFAMPASFVVGLLVWILLMLALLSSPWILYAFGLCSFKFAILFFINSFFLVSGLTLTLEWIFSPREKIYHYDRMQLKHHMIGAWIVGIWIFIAESVLYGLLVGVGF